MTRVCVNPVQFPENVLILAKSMPLYIPWARRFALLARLSGVDKCCLDRGVASRDMHTSVPL